MKCPHCKKNLPKKKNLCSCGAYRVTEENHDKSYIEIYGDDKK